MISTNAKITILTISAIVCCLAITFAVSVLAHHTIEQYFIRFHLCLPFFSNYNSLKNKIHILDKILAKSFCDYFEFFATIMICLIRYSRAKAATATIVVGALYGFLALALIVNLPLEISKRMESAPGEFMVGIHRGFVEW